MNESIDIVEFTKIPRKAKIFLKMISKIEVGSISIKLPDLSIRHFSGIKEGPYATLWIKDYEVINRLVSSSDIGLAESYRDGLVETENLCNLVLFACLNQKALEDAFRGSFLGMIFYRLRHLLRFNSKTGSRKNIEAHYDLGNAFYKIWLDPTMSYSSALFHSRSESLESAQLNKYRRILDKLNLKPNDHILEIGCGWGKFAEIAVKDYGARLTCITLSKEQYDYVLAMISRENLQERIEVKICDYRDEKGLYDHVVSIEMIEAVGEPYWDTYFEVLNSRVKQGGRVLIQSITILDELFQDYRRGTDFIQQYIFPGGMLLTPQNIKSRAQNNGLRVDDYFEFGEDYALTLKKWSINVNCYLEEIKLLGFDDKFLKIWNFYLAYCEAGFLSKRISVAQVLFTKV